MSEWKVAGALLASAACSIGFVVALLLEAGTPVKGVLLAAALGGIGLGLVEWASRVLPPTREREHREPIDSSAEEERAFASDFGAAARATTRRRLLGGLFGGALAALALALAVPLRALSRTGRDELLRTGWGPGRRVVSAEGEPVHVETLPVGGTITAFPEGRPEAFDSTVILVRVAEGDVPGEQRTGAPAGYLAYSKLCTHAGCPVGLYDPESRLLTCPCHHSAFRVLEGARPMGGPAGRPLPWLPLGVDDDGYLVAVDDFDRPVGPGFWEATRT